jgi:Leucine-rich repeat (LRR) protein
MQQKSCPDVFDRNNSATLLKRCVSAIVMLFVSMYSFSQTTEDNTFIYHSVDEAVAAGPEKVFRLNLSKKKLDSIPQDVFKFYNLIELDLSRNRIEEIPPDINRLVNLEKLNLTNNRLVHLPAEIGSLTRLKFLGLNRNVIEDLPSTIGDLSQLEVLELWDNELADVPDEIGKLQNLKVLELRGILFSEEQQQRIDALVVRSAKIFMSPSCNCKY